MNNFNEWIQCFLNETENILPSDKQISIIKTTLNLFNGNKTEDKQSNQSIDLLKNEEENKPTNIQYDQNGNVLFKAWWINGKLYNDNGPAYIKYDQNGNVQCKEWYVNDKLHNNNGPAHIAYYENGNVSRKSWYINDQRHNENGPAIIEYDQSGNIIKQEYWKNGIKIK